MLIRNAIDKSDKTKVLTRVLFQGKLNIVLGRISTINPVENQGRCLKTRKYFSVLINKLDFHRTNGSPSLPICLQYALVIIIVLSIQYFFTVCNFSAHQGSISPNFVCQAKRCRRTALGKKFTVQFHLQSKLKISD